MPIVRKGHFTEGTFIVTHDIVTHDIYNGLGHDIYSPSSQRIARRNSSQLLSSQPRRNSSQLNLKSLHCPLIGQYFIKGNHLWRSHGWILYVCGAPMHGSCCGAPIDGWILYVCGTPMHGSCFVALPCMDPVCLSTCMFTPPPPHQHHQDTINTPSTPPSTPPPPHQPHQHHQHHRRLTNPIQPSPRHHRHHRALTPCPCPCKRLYPHSNCAGWPGKPWCR